VARRFGLPNVVVTPHLGASTRQAQDKAGLMVAEAVDLALRGDFVPSAVNLQVSAAVTDHVRAFMGLTTTLGRLFTALHEGVTSAITVEYRGRVADEDTSALNLAALTGLLSDVVDEPVTYVNAPLTAQDRGLKLVTMTSPAARDYVSLVRLTAEGEQAVAGTLTGPTNTERLVELWGFGIDMVPSDHMVFLRDDAGRAARGGRRRADRDGDRLRGAARRGPPDRRGDRRQPRAGGQPGVARRAGRLE
jgi:D-3-phosphoglycerate dehydrogenase